MSENVLQQLETKSQGLAAKMQDNIEVAKVFMGFLGRVILMAAQKGLPVEGITFSNPQMEEKRITAHITFTSLSVPTGQLYGRSSNFQEFVGAKSKNMARALQRNPGIVTFFDRVLRLIDGYADFKGIPFARLKVYKAFIDPDNNLVLWLKHA